MSALTLKSECASVCVTEEMLQGLSETIFIQQRCKCAVSPERKKRWQFSAQEERGGVRLAVGRGTPALTAPTASGRIPVIWSPGLVSSARLLQAAEVAPNTYL